MVCRKVAVFSLRRITGLVKSTAYMKAAQSYTTLVRPKFSDSSIWNAVLVTITGEPGYADIATDVRAIDSAQSRISDELMDGVFRSAAMGPAALVDFLLQLELDRQAASDSMQFVYRSARAISGRITGDLETAVTACATIKFASTIVVAAVPVGLTLAAAAPAAVIAGTGWVAFGFSVTKSLAKDYAEARNSGVIAFDTSLEQDPVHAAKKAGDIAADKIAEKMEKRIETETDLIEAAEQKILMLSRAVAKKVSAKKLAKTGRRIEAFESKIAASARSMTWAKGTRMGARVFQIAFAAHDIYEGWEDFEKDIGWEHAAH